MFGNLDFNPLMSVDLAYLNQLISVNMLGAVVMTRAVVPHMKPGAAIVNQSSTAAWMNIDYYRSEEHTSELQSLMRISYAVFCLKKKKKITVTQPSRKINTSNSSTLKTTEKQDGRT